MFNGRRTSRRCPIVKNTDSFAAAVSYTGCTSSDAAEPTGPRERATNFPCCRLERRRDLKGARIPWR